MEGSPRRHQPDDLGAETAPRAEDRGVAPIGEAGPAVREWRLPLGTDRLPFHELLRAYRVAAGLSQNLLARLASTDPAYVHRLEKPPGDPRRGSNLRPSREVALALADALGLPPSETDYFLWKAGHATIIDWQARALAAEVKLARLQRILEEP